MPGQKTSEIPTTSAKEHGHDHEHYPRGIRTRHRSVQRLRRTLDAFAAVLADNIVFRAPGPTNGKGKVGCAELFAGWFGAFPTRTSRFAPFTSSTTSPSKKARHRHPPRRPPYADGRRAADRPTGQAGLPPSAALPRRQAQLLNLMFDRLALLEQIAHARNPRRPEPEAKRPRRAEQRRPGNAIFRRRLESRRPRRCRSLLRRGVHQLRPAARGRAEPHTENCRDMALGLPRSTVQDRR